jgi:hypothetical protein
MVKERIYYQNDFSKPISIGIFCILIGCLFGNILYSALTYLLSTSRMSSGFFIFVAAITIAFISALFTLVVIIMFVQLTHDIMFSGKNFSDHDLWRSDYAEILILGETSLRFEKKYFSDITISEIPYSKINNIKVFRVSIFGRKLGTISIYYGSRTTPKTFSSVENPEQLRDEILERIKNNNNQIVDLV